MSSEALLQVDVEHAEPDLSSLSVSLMSMLLEMPAELRREFAAEILDLRGRLTTEFGSSAPVSVLVDEACGALLDARHLGLVSRSLLAEGLVDGNLRRAEKLDTMADRSRKRLHATLMTLERLRPSKASVAVVGVGDP